VIKKPRGRGDHSPHWAAEPEKIKSALLLLLLLLLNSNEFIPVAVCYNARLERKTMQFSTIHYNTIQYKTVQ
jgi:hypothetical protein